jgi:uncharacterized integral membrane protein (TIGR00697 family)
MLYAVAPILSNRIVSIFGFKLIVGAITIDLAYGLVDVLNNCLGKPTARRAIIIAMFSRFVLWSIIGLSFLLPTFKEPQGYTKILSQGFRIFLAGELSLFLSQYLVDINLFHYFKKFNLKFWARYNLSNIFGQFVSTTVFVSLAYLGTGIAVMPLIVGSYVFKYCFTVLLTPVFSLVNSKYAGA